MGASAFEDGRFVMCFGLTLVMSVAIIVFPCISCGFKRELSDVFIPNICFVLCVMSVIGCQCTILNSDSYLMKI